MDKIGAPKVKKRIPWTADEEAKVQKIAQDAVAGLVIPTAKSLSSTFKRHNSKSISAKIRHEKRAMLKGSEVEVEESSDEESEEDEEDQKNESSSSSEPPTKKRRLSTMKSDQHPPYEGFNIVVEEDLFPHSHYIWYHPVPMDIWSTFSILVSAEQIICTLEFSSPSRTELMGLPGLENIEMSFMEHHVQKTWTVSPPKGKMFLNHPKLTRTIDEADPLFIGFSVVIVDNK